MREAIQFFLNRFKEIDEKRRAKGWTRRIGSELKFPLVSLDGRAADLSATSALWEFLIQKGWTALFDNHMGKVVGATKPGEFNEHRAACETGFCKVEFSLAHSADLHDLHHNIRELEIIIEEFSQEFGVAFLGFGMQPITPPGRHLLMKKSRNVFWERMFGGNEFINQEHGSDVHLFTISASNQVHIDVSMHEAIDAINVFNGMAGPQVAMTANSNIWKGYVHPQYKCLGEMFWDWWLQDKHPRRYGVPEKKFIDLEDYFNSIVQFSPVFVKRENGPVGLPFCPSFLDFFTCHDENMQCKTGFMRKRHCGLTVDENEIKILRDKKDLDQHFTFFWHNARLSRYYTLENRINDQQPPGEMMTVPALTLGVMENLQDAVSLIGAYPWDVWQALRIEACRSDLEAQANGIKVSDLSKCLLKIAETGLKKRGLGEEIFLEPLKERLRKNISPADLAADVFNDQGPKGFVKRFRI